MTLEQPIYLWGLLLLLPIAAIQFRAYWGGQRSLKRLHGGELPTRFAAVYYVKWFFSSAFFLAAIAFLVLSLVGVNWGSQPVEDNRQDVEVVFVVDVSHSMLAQDISPSRLGRSIELMRGVISALPGSRFGVTAFKGEGITVVPVTENRYAFDSLERLLSPDIITAPWTHIDRGLAGGREAFPVGSSRNQVLVLFSDGENHGRSPLETASELGRRGIPVVSVTLGSDEGAVIPLPEAERVLHDRRDRVVVSRADFDLMQQIADVSQGLHLDANDPGALGGLIGFLEQKQGQISGIRQAEVQRYRLLLLLGLICFVLHELIRIVRWKGVF